MIIIIDAFIFIIALLTQYSLVLLMIDIYLIVSKVVSRSTAL